MFSDVGLEVPASRRSAFRAVSVITEASIPRWGRQTLMTAHDVGRRWVGFIPDAPATRPSISAEPGPEHPDHGKAAFSILAKAGDPAAWIWLLRDAGRRSQDADMRR